MERWYGSPATPLTRARWSASPARGGGAPGAGRRSAGRWKPSSSSWRRTSRWSSVRVRGDAQDFQSHRFISDWRGPRRTLSKRSLEKRGDEFRRSPSGPVDVGNGKTVFWGDPRLGRYKTQAARHVSALAVGQKEPGQSSSEEQNLLGLPLAHFGRLQAGGCLRADIQLSMPAAQQTGGGPAQQLAPVGQQMGVSCWPCEIHGWHTDWPPGQVRVSATQLPGEAQCVPAAQQAVPHACFCGQH